MANRALIVIDLQNDYFPGGKWTLHEVDAAADNAARLIAAARESGELVVHLRHEFPTDDAPFFADLHCGTSFVERSLALERGAANDPFALSVDVTPAFAEPDRRKSTRERFGQAE